MRKGSIKAPGQWQKKILVYGLFGQWSDNFLRLTKLWLWGAKCVLASNGPSKSRTKVPEVECFTFSLTSSEAAVSTFFLSERGIFFQTRKPILDKLISEYSFRNKIPWRLDLVRMRGRDGKRSNFIAYMSHLPQGSPGLPPLDPTLGSLSNNDRDGDGRLQNNSYFCVFKYARAVKQKVWNEAENREQD